MSYILRNTCTTLLFLFVLSPLINAQVSVDQANKTLQLYHWIENSYVDSVDLVKLNEELIRQLLQKLDPHSTYISKKNVETFNESLKGNFDGVGITIGILDDTAIIINVIKDGPCYKAGIKPGDRLIIIDNQVISGVGANQEYIKNKLHGKKGSEVDLGISRPGYRDILSYIITRNTIPLPSITGAYLVCQQTGYIKLNRFALTTATELQTVFETFQKQKVKNIILDLTDNSGGYLDAAISLTEEFLSKGKLIVYTKGIHTEERKYASSKNGIFENGKLVVMINESSASASEIVAGAIQDWDRGVIVGRRSFGKGLVQRPLMFTDSSMIRLTVSRYFTPSGRLIQKSYNKGYKAYTQDLNNRFENGELSGKEIFTKFDTVKYLTMIKKRVVHGGGGIIPDVFVPMDTLTRIPYLIALEKTSSISDYALWYVERYRHLLQSNFKNVHEFNDRFHVTDSLLYHLADYAEKNKSVTYGKEDIEAVKVILPYILKANIAQDLWDESAYIEIINPINNCFIKALEVVQQWNNYTDFHN